MIVSWEVVGYRLEVLKPMVIEIDPNIVPMETTFLVVAKINPHFILIWQHHCFWGRQKQSSFDAHLEASCFCCKDRFQFDHYLEALFVLASKSNLSHGSHLQPCFLSSIVCHTRVSFSYVLISQPACGCCNWFLSAVSMLAHYLVSSSFSCVSCLCPWSKVCAKHF